MFEDAISVWPREPTPDRFVIAGNEAFDFEPTAFADPNPCVDLLPYQFSMSRLISSSFGFIGRRRLVGIALEGRIVQVGIAAFHDGTIL